MNHVVSSQTVCLAYATYHIITASCVFEAEPDVTLIVDGRRIGKLVRLEVDLSGSFRIAVVEWSHDLIVDWTTADRSTTL